MVRINKSEGGGEVELSVQGRLVGPWVEELRRTLAALDVPASQVALDLARVGYVDRAGQALLRELTGAGVRVGRRSGFVAVLLEEWERDGGAP